MKLDTPLDYAVFQLSPKRSRCDLFVSSEGKTEKLASGFLKPFESHLRTVKEQVARAVQLIKLDREKHKNAGSWFTKGTLERFVLFVYTPELLDLVNKFDAEISQLEAARRIYLQGAKDHLSVLSEFNPGQNEIAGIATGDITQKELLRAIDTRLTAVKQDLSMACARASAAGFTLDNISELLIFADCFGAPRLREACSKLVNVFESRPDLWKGIEERTARSSSGSYVSIDDSTEEQNVTVKPNRPHTATPTSSSQEQEADAARLSNGPSKPSTCQPRAAAVSLPFVRSSGESRRERQISDGAVEKETENVTEPSLPSQPARRLSVQDRINLFESKQKENNKVAATTELRRLSFELSSSSPSTVIEKSVLKRWGGEKKETERPEPTTEPCSSLNSQTQCAGFNGRIGERVEDAEVSKDEMGGEEGVGLKDRTAFETQLRDLSPREAGVGLKDHASSETQFEEQQVVQDSGLKDQVLSQTQLVDVGLTHQPATQTQFRNSSSELKGVVSNSKDPLDSQIQFKAVSHKAEGVKKDPASYSGASHRVLAHKEEKLNKSELLAPQCQWRTSPDKVEGIGKKESMSSQMQFAAFPTKAGGFGDSALRGMQFYRKSSATDQSRMLQGVEEGSVLVHGNGESGSLGVKITESPETVDPSARASIEQVQKVRQSRGNQELNDELQMKANELEKLFAEHKLRVPGDQMSSSRRSKLADVPNVVNGNIVEVAPTKSPEKTLPSGPSESLNNKVEFDANLLMKIIHTRGHSNIVKQRLADFGPSQDFRGKFYDRYMEKRDAKLREEWGSKRAQKEAKMKAMQDSLDHSRAEMKAKFSEPTDKQESAALHARQCAEKLRSFNVRSGMKNKEQQPESIQSEEEYLPEISEQTHHGQDRSVSETLFSDGSSRSNNPRKLLPNRSMSSSIPRLSVPPIPRSSAKATNSRSNRRRLQTENSLIQLVPNFSDLRKENTKPSSGLGKITTRSQSRNYSRSKSTSEEIALVKEDKPRCSQSLRKSSASPGELKDLSAPPNSESAVLAPLRFSKEQSDHNLYNKIPKNSESKPFLRKGNGIGPGAGRAKLKASMTSENLKYEEDCEELPDQLGDSNGPVEEEEDFERATGEEALNTVDFPAVPDNEKLRLSQESENSGDLGSENSETLRSSLSQVDEEVASAMATISSKYIASIGTALDSPGESPASWNLHAHHSLSYMREASDIDVSVDSPIGSPASWNSHSLNQMMEVDAARMRKKWGSAQIPLLVANTSQQSRKDVTKGFKRLLNFGRKSRPTESPTIDWVSASTTSEGDDDTEDGRDPANRLSEDLRKTRMGSSQCHASYDGFNEGEGFNEQVLVLRSSIPTPPANFKLREDHISGSSLKAPRSFFSLSSFRSKVSESKPR